MAGSVMAAQKTDDERVHERRSVAGKAIMNFVILEPFTMLYISELR